MLVGDPEASLGTPGASERLPGALKRVVAQLIQSKLIWNVALAGKPGHFVTPLGVCLGVSHG